MRKSLLLFAALMLALSIPVAVASAKSSNGHGNNQDTTIVVKSGNGKGNGNGQGQGNGNSAGNPHHEEADGCDHGATGKPCKDDPQPDHGKDCEKHGNHGGINEDHCSGGSNPPPPPGGGGENPPPPGGGDNEPPSGHGTTSTHFFPVKHGKVSKHQELFVTQ